MIFNIEFYLSEKRALINSYLKELYKSSPKDESSLLDSINYTLNSEGKRLRPILCISACEFISNEYKNVVGIACAIEMVHCYSLIHDDLPSMDDDSLRRGKPTNHVVFGEAAAILAGDALLADAFSLISKELVLNTSDINLALEVISTLADSIGSKGMVLGQAMDLYFEGKKEVDIETVRKIHFLKTGALIESSILIGALIGRADKEEIEILKEFSRKLGLSFQISDDILDITGSKDFGKKPGSDARSDKTTYASILGLKKSRKLVKELTEEAINLLDKVRKESNSLREIAVYLSERAN
ncbi:MAG: polyprenyl synthetase family protein [Thermodesulfobacteriota bacterium]